ncbi:MAG: hypothetical protein H6611_09865 [Ignavibacteriales bacterium]|nr:hypothetical protein [Ignavibacteriales bacterium]
MIKKDFESELFNQTIEKDAENYEALVKAELLYRIKKLDMSGCTCDQCYKKRIKLLDYFYKLEPPPPKFVA